MVTATINKVVGIALGLTVFYLLASTIILPRFNESYNTGVTGLATSTIQGLNLLPLVIGMLGVAIYFLPRVRKGR